MNAETGKERRFRDVEVARSNRVAPILKAKRVFVFRFFCFLTF